MTACTSFLVFFGSKCLAFAEKNTFSSRLLAVEAREAVRRQAIGKSRWQTAGLSTIRARGTPPPRAVSNIGGMNALDEPVNGLAKRGAGAIRKRCLQKGIGSRRAPHPLCRCNDKTANIHALSPWPPDSASAQRRGFPARSSPAPRTCPRWRSGA